METSTVSQVYQSGGTILYPSDTLWALGCDPRNEDAVQKVSRIKQRSAGKSFIILLSTAAHIEHYVRDVPAVAYDLIEFAENPLTLVFDNASRLAPSVLGPNDSVAVRVVKEGFCFRLIQSLRGPLLSTSANISGEEAPRDLAGVDPAISSLCDFVYPQTTSPKSTGKPSTIIKMAGNGTFRFIRR